MRINDVKIIFERENPYRSISSFEPVSDKLPQKSIHELNIKSHAMVSFWWVMRKEYRSIVWDCLKIGLTTKSSGHAYQRSTNL